MKHPISRTALAVAGLALAGIAGCGDDNKAEPTNGGGQAAASAPAPATATATATATQTTPTATSTAPLQREAVVPGKEATLKSGDIGLNVKVLKVVDPVAAAVARAQEGKTPVGVFVTGKADGVGEPTKTSSTTTLKTNDGTITGIRIIADGDCGGGFSANELLLASKKPVTGCIGFEIPKSATPEAITIVLTSAKGTEQATWELPKAQ